MFKITICTAAALIGVALSGALSAQSIKPTPQDTEGPYYPVAWKGDVDFDLLTFNGKAFARGTPLTLTGTVTDTRGAPIANARIEIWQTDDTGKYRHPNDDGEAPAQRGFQGYGFSMTDAKGEYRFLTIKPVIYGGRPAHIHLRAIASKFTPLTTQVYFAGENKESGLLSGFAGFSKERDALTVSPATRIENGKTVLNARYNVVLADQQ